MKKEQKEERREEEKRKWGEADREVRVPGW